ncbi:DDE-type integrase/transposase/recombinase [Candidatus Woesearchaeota archaeon]|nr:DDE-type integrase/transposase/recombinase [Candidatus Woesearchaeota archaeon]
MAFRTVSPLTLATLFCLAVVRQRWPGQVPTLTAAAEELGVSRELAPRLRARLLEPVVELIARTSRPGPKSRDPVLEVSERRLHILEAFLGVARTIIAAAGIAALATWRRDELVTAVEQLHERHGVPYEQIAEELGLPDRTLRRLRARAAAGESLAPKSRAPQSPHGKLPDPLANAISDFVKLFPALPLAELHRRFLEEKRDLCLKHEHPNLAYTTFARASGRPRTNKSGHGHSPRRGRDAPENLPFRALALMDTTSIECFGFDFDLIGFMEAHSRELFAHQLCDQETAEHVKQVIDEGCEEAGGVLALRVDRGTPYLAEATVVRAEEQGIDMRVAKAYTPTDKAILERFFRTAKEALSSILKAIDLRKELGDTAECRALARRLGAAVIAGYMRWGYPYIPQPYIDGLSPRERTEPASSLSEDDVSAILDERARHYEHAQAVARELHHAYGFRWSITRWLGAVRGYTAEDLREASRRFDKVLLRTCFQCDTRRTPNYLLAIVRNLAANRRERQARARTATRKSERRRLGDEAHRRECQEEERLRAEDPRGAAERAVDLARIAFANDGHGITTASAWLRQALQTIAERGQFALELHVSHMLDLVDTPELKVWLQQHVVEVQPSTRTIQTDLLL